MKKPTLFAFPGLSPLLTSTALLVAGLFLSGCAAAVMTGAKTAKGSESNNVIILEKTENVTAVNSVTVDASGLRNRDAAGQKELADRITSLLIADMKEEGLYQPDNTDGFEVTVTIRNMKRDVNERAVYAIVNVLNAKKEAIFSFAAVETSEGLRTIDYIEKTFAESAVQEIAAPVEKPVADEKN